MAKDEDYRRMINTARWQRLRAQTLKTQPLCRRCREKGRVTAATEVHHVVPVESAVTTAEKERLMYDPANLRALCHACHVLTHKELGRGKALTRQRTEAATRSFADRYL